MKNVILFWALWMAPVCVISQTVAIEKALLNKALKDGTMTAEEVTDRVRMLREIEKIYPAIPYDSTTGRIVIPDVVISFPGVTKVQAFKRVKEWAALTFNDLESVVEYEDMESGKIILEGWTSVVYSSSFKNIWGKVKSVPDERRLMFSLIVTVKDGKAKVGYENLKYRHTIAGYINSANQYVPKQELEYPVLVSFPLAFSEPGLWKGAIDLMNKTMDELKSAAPRLEKYVRAFVEDYGF